MSKANKGGYQILDFSQFEVEDGYPYNNLNLSIPTTYVLNIGLCRTDIEVAVAKIYQAICYTNKPYLITGLKDRYGNICPDFYIPTSITKDIIVKTEPDVPTSAEFNFTPPMNTIVNVKLSRAYRGTSSFNIDITYEEV